MIRNIYKRLAATFALFTFELLFVWLLFMVCIVAFLYIGAEMLQGDTLAFDEAAFDFAASLGSPFMDSFIKAVTFFASQQFLIPAGLLLIAYFLFVRRHRWYSLKVPVVALGSISLNLILKYFFDRERPMAPLVHASGLSFPSGHSMMAASFYGLIIYLVWDNVKNEVLKYILTVLLLIFVFLIGFSRIYLRVHYATDVLAGFAAGFLWVIVGITMLRRIERYSRKEITPVLQDEPLQEKEEVD